MPSRAGKFLLAFGLAAFAAPAAAQHGAITVPRNLEQLTDRAAVIVRATVTSAKVEKHPQFDGLNTVVVTLRIRETLKGQASGVHTFRQYIWDIRDAASSGGYRKGQDLLLLLIAPSPYGLSSPAGQEQGRFHIRRDAEGREVAVNGSGNLRLFDGVDAQVAKEGIALSPRSQMLVEGKPRGPVEWRDLRILIRDLVAGSR